MRADIGAVELEDQVGEAVDDERLAVEARCGVDHAEDPAPARDAIEIADGPLQAAEDRERP